MRTTLSIRSTLRNGVPIAWKWALGGDLSNMPQTVADSTAPKVLREALKQLVEQDTSALSSTTPTTIDNIDRVVESTLGDNEWSEFDDDRHLLTTSGLGMMSRPNAVLSSSLPVDSPFTAVSSLVDTALLAAIRSHTMGDLGKTWSFVTNMKDSTSIKANLSMDLQISLMRSVNEALQRGQLLSAAEPIVNLQHESASQWLTRWQGRTRREHFSAALLETVRIGYTMVTDLAIESLQVREPAATALMREALRFAFLVNDCDLAMALTSRELDKTMGDRLSVDWCLATFARGERMEHVQEWRRHLLKHRSAGSDEAEDRIRLQLRGITAVACSISSLQPHVELVVSVWEDLRDCLKSSEIGAKVTDGSDMHRVLVAAVVAVLAAIAKAALVQPTESMQLLEKSVLPVLMQVCEVSLLQHSSVLEALFMTCCRAPSNASPRVMAVSALLLRRNTRNQLSSDGLLEYLVSDSDPTNVLGRVQGTLRQGFHVSGGVMCGVQAWLMATHAASPHLFHLHQISVENHVYNPAAAGILCTHLAEVGSLSNSRGVVLLASQEAIRVVSQELPRNGLRDICPITLVALERLRTALWRVAANDADEVVVSLDRLLVAASEAAVGRWNTMQQRRHHRLAAASVISLAHITAAGNHTRIAVPSDVTMAQLGQYCSSLGVSASVVAQWLVDLADALRIGNESDAASTIPALLLDHVDLVLFCLNVVWTRQARVDPAVLKALDAAYSSIHICDGLLSVRVRSSEGGVCENSLLTRIRSVEVAVPKLASLIVNVPNSAASMVLPPMTALRDPAVLQDTLERFCYGGGVNRASVREAAATPSAVERLSVLPASYFVVDDDVRVGL